MNKDFEQEYRHMIESELPDLWDRIEAQLPEHKETEQKKTEQKKTEKRKTNIKYMQIIITAAAAVLLVLAIPVALSLRNGGQNSEFSVTESATSSEAAGDDLTSTAEPSEMTDAVEAADCDESGGALENEEPAVEGASIAPSASAESNEIWMDGGTMDTAQEMPPSADGAEGAWDTTQNAEESEIEEEAPKSQELVQADVRIVDIVTDKQGNTLYQAEILQSTGDLLIEGRGVYLRFAKEGEEENYGWDQGEGVDQELLTDRQYSLSLYLSGEKTDGYDNSFSDRDLYDTEIYVIYEIISMD